MDGWNVDKREQKDGKRVGEGLLHVHPQHRRSKSASERFLDVPRNGVVCSRKEQKETPASPPSARAYGIRSPRSPLHDPFSINGRNCATNQRASLEKDIEQLQSRLQQEKSMRVMLEKAMGRTSSTLSPGHRHVAAKTKELIAEIELLEEEVANREQHVLSLYRSIFEHCVSQSSSNQSSNVASPAHTKHVTRKHPSIISSAFCSSKKFPLKPLQSLMSTDDARKRTSRSSHLLPSNAKTDVHFDNACSNTTKVPVKESPSRLRTLKDHLYQCPSKLSEEMVRYMAAVYCWLRSTSIDHAKSKSRSMSKSSTNIILPRREAREDNVYSSKSVVEISWISTDKGQFSRASYAINNYRLLVEQLERVNISQIEDDAKIAFWINVYNSLVMHAYLAYGIPNSSLRRLALFHKAAYNIGGHIISASAIEQSIFGFRTFRIGWWLETIVSAALRKRSGEERQIISSKYGLQSNQSLVCFALCTGAISDPVLKVYTALNLREELESAKRGFLQANVVVKKSKVFLSKVLDRFSREASISADDLLSWVVENVDKKLRDTIHKCIEHKSNKKASQVIEWLPYSSRFQYVFSKDLMEKPWWY